ncbi:MAG: hypothetical protein AB1472_02170, partial [Candidatus Omnitrophota bacterium]
MSILSERNKQQIKDFFKITLPSDIEKDSTGNYLFERFDQKKIMEIIDFTPPFLKIQKIAVLGSNREDIYSIKGIATGILTFEDTNGHYNNAIHLAQCGQLMASAASIYLAILFPSTAPQVVKVDQIKLSPQSIL